MSDVPVGAPVTNKAGYVTEAYRAFLQLMARALVNIAAGIVTDETTFAGLPSAPVVGQIANVSDSNTATWGATVAAGGANRIAARWNGSNWTVTGK